MTNFYVTYRLSGREARDAFYKDVKACGAGEKTRLEEGCIRYEFFFPADSDSDVFLWEQWESREAQQKHLKQPHYLEFAKIKEHYNVETDITVEDQIVNA